MTERDTPRTRFGAVPFEVLWGSDALQMPDWTFDSLYSTRHVPGSNRNVTQLLGKGPQRLTLTLELASAADLRALKARVQEVDTLVLDAAMTSATDTTVDIHGEGYVEVANAVLLSLSDPWIGLDGLVQVTATFQRGW